MDGNSQSKPSLKPSANSSSSSSSSDTTVVKKATPAIDSLRVIIPFIDDQIPIVIHVLIIGYLFENKDENKDDQRTIYPYQAQLRFLGNIKTLYKSQAEKIAHNLVWQMDIENTLTFAKRNPQSLLIEDAKITDPFGQQIKGTVLQILQATGDRNPRALKPGEKNFGLVEELRSCFLEMPHEYDRQLEEWRRRGEEGTKSLMAPYVRAIEILCQEIITDNKKISEAVSFETLLMLPCAKKFRKALAADRHHVVTSGLVWSWEIMLEFFRIWEANANNDKVKDKNRPNLGGFYSLRSDLFAAIVYPSLQNRAPRCDFALQKKGMKAVIAGGELPDRIDFSIIDPAEFTGFGISFCFCFLWGKKYTLATGAWWAWRECAFIGGFLQNLCRAKTSAVDLCNTRKSTHRIGDNVVSDNSPSASAAS